MPFLQNNNGGNEVRETDRRRAQAPKKMDGQMQNRQGDADVGIVPKRGDAAGDYVAWRPLAKRWAGNTRA